MNFAWFSPTSCPGQVTRLVQRRVPAGWVTSQYCSVSPNFLPSSTCHPLTRMAPRAAHFPSQLSLAPGASVPESHWEGATTPAPGTPRPCFTGLPHDVLCRPQPGMGLSSVAFTLFSTSPVFPWEAQSLAPGGARASCLSIFWQYILHQLSLPPPPWPCVHTGTPGPRMGGSPGPQQCRAGLESLLVWLAGLALSQARTEVPTFSGGQ